MLLNGVISIALFCCIVLAGCSYANSINETFFIWDQRCNVEIFEKNNSSRDKDYGEAIEVKGYYVSFKMIDGKLNVVIPFDTLPVSYLDNLPRENVNEAKIGEN